MLTMPEQSECLQGPAIGEPARIPGTVAARRLCGDPSVQKPGASGLRRAARAMPMLAATFLVSLGLLAGYALGAPGPFRELAGLQATPTEVTPPDTKLVAFAKHDRLAVWPGLQTADRENSSRACINGLVYEKRFGAWRAAALPAPLDAVSGLPSNCRARGL